MKYIAILLRPLGKVIPFKYAYFVSDIWFASQTRSIGRHECA